MERADFQFLHHPLSLLLAARIGEDPFAFVELGAVGAFCALAVFGFDVDVGLDVFSQLAGFRCWDCYHSDSAAAG